jgi:hypothetical protein
MNILSLLISILLAILLVVFIVLVPVAIIFNVRAGMVYREKLAGQIDKLRLGKMLAALGIDVDTYISREHTVDIREHMTRCNACTNTEKCDEQLGYGDVVADDLGYCNNEQSLQELSRTLK